MTAPRRIALLNPNSNPATTEAMLGLARATAFLDFEIVGFTADHAPTMLTRPRDLDEAADRVGRMLAALAAEGFSAALVAAFGDPGVDRSKATAPLPSFGFAEAGMTLAARGGRRFSVVTTTPELAASIVARATALGLTDRFASVRLTVGDPLALMDDEAELAHALAEAAAVAVAGTVDHARHLHLPACRRRPRRLSATNPPPSTHERGASRHDPSLTGRRRHADSPRCSDPTRWPAPSAATSTT